MLSYACYHAITIHDKLCHVRWGYANPCSAKVCYAAMIRVGWGFVVLGVAKFGWVGAVGVGGVCVGVGHHKAMLSCAMKLMLSDAKL